MSDTLILKPSGNGGCIPEPILWKPTGRGPVKIDNQSGFEQKLTKITQGALNPSPHREITIAKDDDWKGTVGPKKVPPYTYEYNDGQPVAGPRTGTIDPS